MSAKKTFSDFTPAEAGPDRRKPGRSLLAVMGLALTFLIAGLPAAFADEATVAPPAPANVPVPASIPAPATDQPLQPVPVDPDIMQARVSFQGGAGMIKGKADSDWSYASVNAVVAPGDSLWVDKQGTMEIEIAQGTYLRLADGSKAEVVSLTPSINIRGVTGSFFVQRMKYSLGDVTFATPVGNVRVGPNSDVRVDILGSGSTTVSARWGQAVIQAQGSDVTVTQGQRSYIDPGYLPSLPAAFDKSAEDSFDTWNRERARLVVAGYEKVPSSVGIPPATLGTSDLGAYGEWVDYDGQEYWHPNIEGYVPYRDGYWDYVPDNGYCWVGYYPFSYTTCHYGRWRYDPGRFGWLWGWQPGWGLGWCATLACGPNFVWCPLDFRNRPCWGFGGPSFFLGGYQFGFGACSFCGIDDLCLGRCSVHPFDHGAYDPFRNDLGIFSINGHGGHFLNFGDRSLRVRDFPPTRTFRGRETLAGFPGGASEQVARLEQGKRLPGVAGAAPPASGRTHPGMRTPMAPSSIRTAQISPSILSNTRQAINRQLSVPHQAMAHQTLGGSTPPNINTGRAPVASRGTTLNNRSIAQLPQQHVNAQGTVTHIRPPATSSERFPVASGNTPRSSGVMAGPPSFHYSQQGFQSAPAPRAAPSFSAPSFRGSAPAPSFRSAPSDGGGSGFHSGGGGSGGGFHNGGGGSGGGFHNGGGGEGGGNRR